jgi:hypothetical protein
MTSSIEHRLGRGRSHTRGRHEDAVVQAEIRLLVRTLSPFGVLQRDALRREARAEGWHEGDFARVLHAATQSGRIDALPFGFYRIPHGRDD